VGGAGAADQDAVRRLIRLRFRARCGVRSRNPPKAIPRARQTQQIQAFASMVALFTRH
jgi:hypothetical protein